MFYLYYYLELLSLTLLGDELYSEEYYSMGKGNINMKSLNKLFSESDIKKDVSFYKSINNSVVFEPKSFNRQIISQTSLSAVSSNVGFKDFNSLDLKFNKINSYDNQQNFYYSNYNTQAIIEWECSLPVDLSKRTLNDVKDNLYWGVVGNSMVSHASYVDNFLINFVKFFPCESIKLGLYHPWLVYYDKISDSFFIHFSTLSPEFKYCLNNFDCINSSDISIAIAKGNFINPNSDTPQRFTNALYIQNLDFQNMLRESIIKNQIDFSLVSSKYSDRNFDYNEVYNKLVSNKYRYTNLNGVIYFDYKLLECCNVDNKKN
jgi:hypothetical protein